MADEIDHDVRAAPFAAAYARQLDRQREQRIDPQVDLAKSKMAERCVMDQDVRR